MLKEYEVHHLNMRDAQIFHGDPKDIDKEGLGKGFCDFYDEPIIDIVFAKDEDDAVKKVSEDTDIHPDNLYAVEHVTSMYRKGKRITASAYEKNGVLGVQIELPDKRTIWVDENGKITGVPNI